jgi:hypothetical protein
MPKGDIHQGCHQCQRGILLAYLQTEDAGSVFVIDGEINTINNTMN